MDLDFESLKEIIKEKILHFSNDMNEIYVDNSMENKSLS
jgi:hypothetical protein